MNNLKPIIRKIDDLDSEKSQNFIRYFCKSLNEKSQSLWIGCGAASFERNNRFSTYIDDIIADGNSDQFKLKWRITQSGSGILEQIEAKPIEVVDYSAFEKCVNDFVSSVYAKAYSSKTNEFYLRKHFSYIGSPIQEELWVDKNTRIGPIEFDDCFFMNSEHVIAVDMLIQAVDWSHATEIANKISKEVAAKFSFLLNIALKSHKKEYRIIPKTKDDEKTPRILTSFIDKESSFPKKGAIVPVSNMSKSDLVERQLVSGYPMSFPRHSLSIIRRMNSATENIRDAFLSACRLYQTGLIIGEESPTAKVAYFYAAIDAISRRTKEFSGFSDFIRRNLDEPNEKLLKFIHGEVRSSHWHSGICILEDVELETGHYLFDKNKFLTSCISNESELMIRSALANWIFSKCQIQNDSTQLKAR